MEEPRILGKATHGLLSFIDAEYEIVAFENPIYELYDAFKKGYYDDLVSFLRIERGLQIAPSILSKDAFSAVYLVFDFEPHYQKYSDDTIKNLLNTFDNETELGKLYINYPMVEAFYDFETLPDPLFIDRTIDLADFSGRKYKKDVNARTCLKKNSLSKKDIAHIINANRDKAKHLCGNTEGTGILDKQLDIKRSHNRIHVLSTLALLPIDYNEDATLDMIRQTLRAN